MIKPRKYYKFRGAFVALVDKGIYPGPTELNIQLERKPINRINGYETKLRRELMHEFNIPFKRDSPYGNAGQIPEGKW